MGERSTVLADPLEPLITDQTVHMPCLVERTIVVRLGGGLDTGVWDNGV
jgi:hypothetical protein